MEFFERTPPDPSRPIERFKVRLTDMDLEAVVRVYEGWCDCRPASLFSEMANRWRGWPGELEWSSPGYELALRSSQDRAGHVALVVELRSGPSDNHWSVRATIEAEAGQLEAIAREAESFFGAASVPVGAEV